MKEFCLDNTIFVDIKDLKMQHKDLFQGIRSYTQFLTQKNIQNYVFGQIVNGALVSTERYAKKKGSIFIAKDDIVRLVESLVTNPESSLGGMPIFPTHTPAIMNEHANLFTDDKGNEYNILIRGMRVREKIFFRVKDVMRVFDLKNLRSDIMQPSSEYSDEHYVSFVVPRSKLRMLKKRELYLTYQGIRKVIEIENHRLGIARQFRKWIDDVVPGVSSKVEPSDRQAKVKVTNVDADHLRSIMKKSASQISCLYLINIGIVDGNQQVFKFGFTDHIQRRFKEHMRRYGDHISLDIFTLIPLLDLSKAETELKNSASRYKYVKEGEDELISLCEEGYQNIKNIFRMISNQYCGNMQHQISHYDGLIKDLKHIYEISIKDKELQLMELQMELMKKDNEILRLQK